jgi:hypothetical protein
MITEEKKLLDQLDIETIFINISIIQNFHHILLQTIEKLLKKGIQDKIL